MERIWTIESELYNYRDGEHNLAKSDEWGEIRWHKSLEDGSY